MVDKLYYMQLFANLVNASPVDTRNMVTHIMMYETNNDFIIEINAPYSSNPKVAKESVNGKSDYAYEVNYGSKSPHQGWVEDQIDLTAKLVGARITYLDKK